PTRLTPATDENIASARRRDCLDCMTSPSMSLRILPAARRHYFCCRWCSYCSWLLPCPESNRNLLNVGGRSKSTGQFASSGKDRLGSKLGLSTKSAICRLTPACD